MMKYGKQVWIACLQYRVLYRTPVLTLSEPTIAHQGMPKGGMEMPAFDLNCHGISEPFMGYLNRLGQSITENTL